MKQRTVELKDVLELGRELGMEESQTELALWFLHHCAGDLMYFKNLPELKETVITDPQIVYDSASCLIIDTFSCDNMPACQRFKETGQFSMKDIKTSTSALVGDYIPLEKLVKLLEHLNIIARITHDPSSPKIPSRTQFLLYRRCQLLHALCPAKCFTQRD